jgi:hypothetical protein
MIRKRTCRIHAVSAVRRGRRRRALVRAVAVVAGCAAAASVAVLAASSFDGQANAGGDPLRGSQQLVDTNGAAKVVFASGGPAVGKAVDGLLADCMKRKGHLFPLAHEGPDSASDKTWYFDFIGDSGSDTPPPPKIVTLADGSAVPVSVTWTPTSCMYIALDTIYGDPLVFQATRRRVLGVRAELEQSLRRNGAAQQALARWTACVEAAGEDATLIEDWTYLPSYSGSNDEACRAKTGLASALVQAIRDETPGLLSRNQHVLDSWASLLQHGNNVAAQIADR